jgi:hypothetical protein
LRPRQAKAANRSTKEVNGVDQGNFHDSENTTRGDNSNYHNSEDEITAESGSKVLEEESMESVLKLTLKTMMSTSLCALCYRDA